MKSLLFGFPLVWLLLGCAPMRFSEFAGSSERDWPTSSESMADHSYAVPVYHSWPERPYKVLGSIHFADPNTYWDDGDTKRAAQIARKKNADAIIIRSGGEFGVAGYTGAAADSKIIVADQRTALAIKWKSNEEIAREREALEQMRARFINRHPGLKPDAHLFELAVRCAKQIAGGENTEELLVQILSQQEEKPEMRWFFRGTIRTTSFASRYTQLVYGVAVSHQSGETITIASIPGAVQVNFAGTLVNGQISGQLGVTVGGMIFSGKANGVFLKKNVSLTSNAITADGTVQSSFTFSR